MRHDVEVPCKRDTKSASKASDRQDLKELSRHPGDSRSPTLDALKAIAAKYTGCRIATEAELKRLKQGVTQNTGMVTIPKQRTPSPVSVKA